MNSNVVVFGATGYTGDLAVQALVRRGVRPVLAGREQMRLERAAQRYDGLEYRIADVNKPASVRAILRAGDTIVATVGPFAKYGKVAAEAAAMAGANYVDSTGEVSFVQEIQREFGDVAASRGATLLPAFGYDYVPGILAGLALDAGGTQAATLRVGYFATSSLKNGLSQGTLTTAADALVSPSPVWRDNTLMQVRTASSLHKFHIRGERKSTYLVSGTEVLFLPELYPALQNVEVYNGWFPETSAFIAGISPFAGAMSQFAFGRKLIGKAISLISKPTAGPGPDAQERARTRSHIVAEVTDSSGHLLSEVHLEGPSTYDLTVELLAEAALRLHGGNSRAVGVTGPLQAFGMDGLTEIARAVNLEVITQ